MDYLDMLSKIGPTAKEIEEKQKAMKEKEYKEGAKQEIKEMQGRISELKEDPSKTYNKSYEYGDEDYCHIQKYEKVKNPKLEYDDAVNDVALGLMANAMDESEAISGYTELINKLEFLKDCCLRSVKKLTRKSMNPDGPEMKPGCPSEAEIKLKLEHNQKILTWIEKTLESTHESVRDELNHNAKLIAQYIEFSGIKPSEYDLKESAKVISVSK